MKIILVMGPQGSGKSTQARLLAESLNMQFLSVGEMLREYVKNNFGPVVESLRNAMNKGELVDFDVARMVVSLFLLEHAHATGLVIDGYPRAIEQYSDFDTVFGKKPDVCFVIDLHDSEIKVRIASRKVTEHRKDETQDAIKCRLEIYRSKTQEVLSQLSRDGVPIYRIDGSGTIESIQNILREQVIPYVKDPN